jgi:nitrite reductase/ring-hydroxylating ferredoxin subunit
MNSDKLDGYIKLCSINDLKEFEGKKFFIKDIDIAVFKIKEEVFALSNRCPHQQHAQIFEGFIEEECVVCPIHGWMFNLKTGRTLSGTTGLTSFETRIIDTEVYVRVPEKEWKW